MAFFTFIVDQQNSSCKMNALQAARYEKLILRVILLLAVGITAIFWIGYMEKKPMPNTFISAEKIISLRVDNLLRKIVEMSSNIRDLYQTVDNEEKRNICNSIYP